MNAPRVLVVDDEPQIVRGLKIILRGAGYAVEAADTKAEALAAVAARPHGTLGAACFYKRVVVGRGDLRRFCGC